MPADSLGILGSSAVEGRIGDSVGAKHPLIDLEDLTVAERIQLAEDLWDSVDPESPELTLTSAQVAELDKRLEQLRRNPDSGEPWEVVRDRLYGCLRREE